MPLYKYPRIKFADTNTIEQQLEHIRSEIVEAIQAFNRDKLGDMDIELHDICQSVETAKHILEEKHDITCGHKPLSAMQNATFDGHLNHITLLAMEAVMWGEEGILQAVCIELSRITFIVEALHRIRAGGSRISTEEGKKAMIQKNYIRGYYES